MHTFYPSKIQESIQNMWVPKLKVQRKIPTQKNKCIPQRSRLSNKLQVELFSCSLNAQSNCLLLYQLCNKFNLLLIQKSSTLKLSKSNISNQPSEQSLPKLKIKFNNLLNSNRARIMSIILKKNSFDRYQQILNE